MDFFCLSRYRRGGCAHTIPSTCPVSLLPLPPATLFALLLLCPPPSVFAHAHGDMPSPSHSSTLCPAPCLYTFPLRAPHQSCPALALPCPVVPCTQRDYMGACRHHRPPLPPFRTLALCTHPLCVHTARRPGLCARCGLVTWHYPSCAEARRGGGG